MKGPSARGDFWAQSTKIPAFPNPTKCVHAWDLSVFFFFMNFKVYSMDSSKRIHNLLSLWTSTVYFLKFKRWIALCSLVRSFKSSTSPCQRTCLAFPTTWTLLCLACMAFDVTTVLRRETRVWTVANWWVATQRKHMLVSITLFDPMVVEFQFYI